MKVVKQISTGDVVHREEPEFEDSKGLQNACVLNNIPLSDLEVADITQQEWTDSQKAKKDKDIDKGKLDVDTAMEEMFDIIKGTTPIPDKYKDFEKNVKDKMKDK